jgi:ATP-binding cassette subfamily B protein
MTERRSTTDRLRAAATMLRIAWVADRRRSILAFGLLSLQSIVDLLFAWWLKLLLDGLQVGDMRGIIVAAGGMVVSLAGGSALAYAGERVRRVLTERAQYAVERRLIDLVALTPTLEIHETPAHLTQLEALEREAWEFGEVVPSLIELFTTGVRIITTGLLLLNVHPLLLLLPLFGVPALLLSSWTGALFQRGNELAAVPARRADHLFELAITAGPAKEVRLFRLSSELLTRFHAAHADIRAIHWRINLSGQLISLATRLVFLVGYVGAIVFVVDRAIAGQATLGDTVLTTVVAGQVFGLLTSSTWLIQFAWSALASASRYVYLEDLARRARQRIHPDAAVPQRLTDGIRLEGVSYRYPLGARDSLHEVTLHLPAGTTVAIVGDNGAGKTTLVKLLAGLYLPAAGTISIDGVDLAQIAPERWRERVSAGFQDHARFEFVVQETVGIGDLAAAENRPAVVAALARAGAADLVTTLPGGLDTQLGASWPAGTDLSGGQWQKLAIGRAMMRPTPLLLLLDEPTAALDADTEYQLFAQWTEAAQQLRQTTGAVTVLVSHRFSTVRMADLIVVLDHGRIAEVGSHTELLARRGLYAELFALQAQSYR